MRLTSLVAILIWVRFANVAAAQWLPIGPDGGSAHVLAIDPQNPKHLLAGSRGLVLYVSDNAGESWSVLNEFATLQQLYQAALNSVSIDPGDRRVYYAGVSATNARPAAENGAGLYRTTDSGNTWIRIPSLAGVSVYCLSIWSKDRHVMAAGTDQGVFRSRDSGESWERVWPEGNREAVLSIAIDPKNSDMIYAGTPHLPWKTSDGGKSWHSIHSGMSDDSDVFSIHIDHRNPDHVYASACSGIYGSVSRGETWAKLPGIPFDNRRTHVITQDPKNPSTLYAATTLGLWKASGGAPFRKTMLDSINDMVLDPQGVMYLAVEHRGLLKSEDGGETFREINTGYVNRSITTMQTAGSPTHPLLYASTVYDGLHGGLFRTEDSTGKWDLLASEEMLNGRNLTSFAALGDSGHLVAASFDGFMRSSDNGRTWIDMASRKAPDPTPQASPAKSPAKKGKTVAKAAPPPVVRTTTVRSAVRANEPPTFPSPKVHINSLKASTGKDPFLIAATSAGLFTSTTGDKWDLMKIAPKVNLPVSAIFVSPGDSGGLAAVTPAGLYISHDSGATWLTTALKYKPDVIYEIAFDYQDPNLLIAATSDGIYESTDGGKTWEFHLGGMDKGAVTSVIFHPRRHAEAYALHDGWIYQTVDGGRHWKMFERAGLSNVIFSTIAFDQSESNPQLYGLSRLRGVFAYHEVIPRDTKNVTPRPHSSLN